MGAISAEELPVALGARADWSPGASSSSPTCAARRDVEPVRIHVKLDTGMGRLGTREREQALARRRARARAPAPRSSSPGR